MSEPEWRTLLGAGRRAVADGDAGAALDALQRARHLAPAEREVRYWLGNALRLAGRAEESERVFRKLIRSDPDDEDAAFGLAWLLRENGRPADAAQVLMALARRSTGDAGRRLKIAGFLRDSNRFADAITVLEGLREQHPGDAGLAFRLARLYQGAGRFDDALACLRAALDRDPSLGGAWLSLAQVQKFRTPDDPDVQRLRQAAARPVGPEADLCVAFALGKACDDLGEREEAWAQFTRGNRLRRAMQHWDRAAWTRRCDALLSEAPPPRSGPPPSGRHPVYIVGMLRSGTTLLEQLLDRHPEVTGRGELNFAAHAYAEFRAGRLDRHAAGETLWTHLRLQGDPAHRFVDKNPLNFRYLGFLADVLPEARFVHVTRDGRDSCLSCYFQLFQHPDAAFADDLDDLVDAYRGYRRLMSHWGQSLGNRILEVDYGDLVRNPPDTVGRVLTFLELDPGQWRERDTEPDRPIRTASTWQARQPVHRRSLARWKDYYEFAPAFFDAVHALDRN